MGLRFFYIEKMGCAWNVLVGVLLRGGGRRRSGGDTELLIGNFCW